MTDLFHDMLMAAAPEEARRAGDAGEVPIGAVSSIGREIVGRGFNQPIGSHDPTANGEIVAIRVYMLSEITESRSNR